MGGEGHTNPAAQPSLHGTGRCKYAPLTLKPSDCVSTWARPNEPAGTRRSGAYVVSKRLAEEGDVSTMTGMMLKLSVIAPGSVKELSPCALSAEPAREMICPILNSGGHEASSVFWNCTIHHRLPETEQSVQPNIFHNHDRLLSGCAPVVRGSCASAQCVSCLVLQCKPQVAVHHA